MAGEDRSCALTVPKEEESAVRTLLRLEGTPHHLRKHQQTVSCLLHSKACVRPRSEAREAGCQSPATASFPPVGAAGKGSRTDQCGPGPSSGLQGPAPSGSDWCQLLWRGRKPNEGSDREIRFTTVGGSAERKQNGRLRPTRHPPH